MKPYWVFFSGFLLADILFGAFLAVLVAKIRLSLSQKLARWIDGFLLLPLVLPYNTISSCFEHFRMRIPIPMMEYMRSYGYPFFAFFDLLTVACFIAFPVLYLCTLLGFLKVRDDVFDAARLQGLKSLGILWHVLLPQSWRLILVGMGLAFLRMLTVEREYYVDVDNIIQIAVSAAILVLILRLGGAISRATSQSPAPSHCV